MTANTYALLRHVLCAALPLLALSADHTSAQDRSEDWQSPSERCEPGCRSGFSCRRGECLPVCSPACAEDQFCTEAGSCIDVAVPLRAAAPKTRARGTQTGCAPGCRNGYACLDDHCVSLCNPLCSVGEMCTSAGTCELAERASEPQEVTEPHAPSSLVNLHIDALGAFQFGLTPTLEVGETLSGFVRLRALNTGVASHFLLGRNRDDELSFGLGAALGGHVFFGGRGNMRGLFAGLALEYVFLQTKETGVDFARHRSHVLVPELDVGYRWAFGALLVDVGGRIGLAIPVSDKASPLGATDCQRPGSCPSIRDLAVFPSVFLDLGWFIPRS